MPDVHLKYSPSGASRWLACPASLNGEHNNNSSAAATEGTAAHALCQRSWLLGMDPNEWLGQEIEGVTVDEDMVAGAQLFLDTVAGFIVEFGDQRPAVSSEVFLQDGQYDDFGGTVDFLIRTPERIVIVDYKYGRYPVNVVSNAQLMCYAILAQRFDEQMVVCIVQPRVAHEDGPVRSWEIPNDTLEAFTEEVHAAIAAGPQEIFNEGDHCGFCPRRLTCPRLQEVALSMAQEAFSDLGNEDEEADRLAEIMNAKKAIMAYLRAVEERAKAKLEIGEPIPGFKLVNAFGNRKYCVDEDTVVKKCRSQKFGKKQIYRTELMSPAQLEKVVGKDLVNSLVERPLNGTTVVPESDKRAALARTTLAETFKEL